MQGTGSCLCFLQQVNHQQDGKCYTPCCITQTLSRRVVLPKYCTFSRYTHECNYVNGHGKYDLPCASLCKLTNGKQHYDQASYLEN